MAERRIRDIYRVNDLNISEINRVLFRIADRLDKLQGDRGTPTFFSDADFSSKRITNVAQATAENDALVNKTGNTIEISNENLQVKYNTLKALTETIEGLEISADGSKAITIDGTNGLQVVVDNSKAIEIDAITGIQVKADGSKAMDIDVTKGLQVIVDNSKAIEIDSTNGLQVKADGSKAMSIDAADGLQVVVDTSKAIEIDSTNGLQIVVDTSKAISIDATNGLQVKSQSGGGIDFDGSGDLFVDTTVLYFDADHINIDTTLYTGTIPTSADNVQLAMDAIDVHTHAFNSLTNIPDSVITLTGAVTGFGTMTDLGDVTINTTLSSLAHSSLTGLATGDDHTQYALLAGRNGDVLHLDTLSAFDSSGLSIVDDADGLAIFVQDSTLNIGIGGISSFGTDAAKVLAIASGTAPSTSPGDAIQMWSADRGAAAGKAGLHIRSEDGTSYVIGDRLGLGIVTPLYGIHYTRTESLASSSIYSIVMETTFNGTLGSNYNGYGFYNVVTNNITLNAKTSTIYGAYISAVNPVGYLCTNLYGLVVSANATHTSGTVTGCLGVQGQVSINGSGGTVAAAYALYANVALTAGTLTTGYGLYVGAVGGTTGWGVYVSNTANPSYFAANIMLGATAIVGTSGTKTLAISTGTTPTSAPADACQLFSKDAAAVAGKAALHTIAESGTDALIVVSTIYKTTTGDPTQVHEGLMVINIFDNTLKFYGDGAWRTLASW